MLKTSFWQPTMSIYSIGINHKTAPIDLREKIYFSLEQISLYLQDLLTRGLVSEAVLLSTCNRSELYCVTHDINAVIAWFELQAGSSCQAVADALYVYQGQRAIAHLMEVACGIDSMIIGEPQIFGQLKAAFSESCAQGAVGNIFQRLFQYTFAIAKEIRTATAIGACPVSVASAAIQFAKSRVVDFNQANIVIVGAGETAELLLRYLRAQTIRPITIVNRSFEKAAQLATANDQVLPIERLPTVLSYADIVLTATGSPIPVIDRNLLQQTYAKIVRAKPLILIDIAVPRDIAQDVQEVANTFLYCIDDLKMIIAANKQGREHAALKAKEMIEQKSVEYMCELQSYDKVTHTIRAYRAQVEAMCDLELAKAKQQLNSGGDPQKILEMFANAFTNKLLHTPSVQMRQAGVEGRLEILHCVKQLFAIPDPESEWA
jgi:glutamyl-tRNA reductase